MLSSAIRAQLANRAEIIGTQGTIAIPEMFFTAQRVELIRPGERIAREFPMPPEHGFKFEIEAVVCCLQRGEQESRLMPLDETLAIMRTLDRIREQMGVRYANDQE